ncbi:hypothetical protein Esti_001836 [Eimeria stiedai]
MSLLASIVASPPADQELEAQMHFRIPGISALEVSSLNSRSPTQLRATYRAVFQQLMGLIAVLAVVCFLTLCFRKWRIHGLGASQRSLAKEEHDGLESKENETQQRLLCETRGPDMLGEESDAISLEVGEEEAVDDDDLYESHPTTMYAEPKRLSTSVRPRRRRFPTLQGISVVPPLLMYGPPPTSVGAPEVWEEARDATGESSSNKRPALEEVSRRAKEAIERSVGILEVLNLLLEEGFQALLTCEAEDLLSTSVAHYVRVLTQSLQAQAQVSLLACERWAQFLSREYVLERMWTIVKAKNLVSEVRSVFDFGPEDSEAREPMASMTLDLRMIFRMQLVYRNSLACLEKLFCEGVKETAALAAQLASAEELVEWCSLYQNMWPFRKGTYAEEQLLLQERKLRGLLKTLRPVVTAFEMWGKNPRVEPLKAVRAYIDAVSALLAIHLEYPRRFILQGLVPWLGELRRVVNLIRERPRLRDGWRNFVRHFCMLYVEPCLLPHGEDLAEALHQADGVIRRVESKGKTRVKDSSMIKRNLRASRYGFSGMLILQLAQDVHEGKPLVAHQH